MKKIINLLPILILTFLFTEEVPKNKIVIEGIEKESSFTYNNNTYNIEVNGELHRNDYTYGNKLLLEYRVFKNGEEIESKDEWNLIFIDCDYLNGGPFDDHFEIETIHLDKSYGWIIYSGGICGNTFSYQTEVIFPPLESEGKLIKSNQLFKSYPNIIKDNNEIKIYYSFQEWNFGGTAWSEFVPQKIIYNIDKHELINGKIETINDLSNLTFDFQGTILDLSINFTSLFMSGFHDLNLDLMQHAVNYLYNPEHIEEWYNTFYGADIESKRDFYTFEDNEKEIFFIKGLMLHYGHNNIKWIQEYYSSEDGFVFHEKEVINTEDKYLRLIDCSKESFQSVIDKLKSG